MYLLAPGAADQGWATHRGRMVAIWRHYNRSNPFFSKFGMSNTKPQVGKMEASGGGGEE
jgi:hypothetical protein